MKKTILIIAILFCFTTTYAQDAKPTKQETMDWIAGKIKIYLMRTTGCVPPNGEQLMISNEFISYENGIVTIKNTVGDGGAIFVRIILNNIAGDNMDENYYELKGENVVEYVYSDNRRVVDNRVSLSIPATRCYIKMVAFSDEILPRFRKALQTLITYNKSEKPKEAF